MEEDAGKLHDIFPRSFSIDDLKDLLQQLGSFDAVFQNVLDFLKDNENYVNSDIEEESKDSDDYVN